MVLGISLGGHAAWHCLFHEPRITTGVVIIGCPDYIRLMSDRARKSKRKTYIESDPPGSNFLGSIDFPTGLVNAVGLYDPVGLCLGTGAHTKKSFDKDPTREERRRLIPLLTRCIEGKRILNLAGGADKLVPYKHSEPFLRWLKRAVSPDGWLKDKQIILEDIVEEGIGHETSPAMVKEAIRFMFESLKTGSARTEDIISKI
jgi:pimeloyl-ACP methyl ester carboxylesterase